MAIPDVPARPMVGNGMRWVLYVVKDFDLSRAQDFGSCRPPEPAQHCLSRSRERSYIRLDPECKQDSL